MSLVEILKDGMQRSLQMTLPKTTRPSQTDPYVIYSNLLASTMKLCLEYLRPLIQESDKATLCAAVEVEDHRGWQTGVLVSLVDRSLVAWTSGVVRRKGSAFEIYPNQVREVIEQSVEPSNGRVPEKVVFSVACGENDPFLLRVPQFKGGASLTFLVQSALFGALPESE